MAIKLDYAVQESVTNMRRNMFMTFAAVLVVTVSLVLFGAVFVLRTGIARTVDLVTRQVRVTVFLAEGVSSTDRDAIHQDLLAMDEVDAVVYESKEEAFRHFKLLFKDEPDLVANATADAMPESFRIKLKDPETFTVVRDRLDGRPGIDKIRDEREIVEKLFATARLVRTLAFLVSMVVGIAALVLIATTIRIAIYARRKEIGIMKLVGATNWFIRVPFMMEGVVQGIIGAVVAAVVLVALKPAFDSIRVGESFSMQIGWGDFLYHGLLLVVAGVVVGALGSVFGLRRFLDV